MWRVDQWVNDITGTDDMHWEEDSGNGGCFMDDESKLYGMTGMDEDDRRCEFNGRDGR